MVNADVPPLPAPGHRPPNFTTLAAAMPPVDLAIFLFNKDRRNKERLCISCRTRYRYTVHCSGTGTVHCPGTGSALQRRHNMCQLLSCCVSQLVMQNSL